MCVLEVTKAADVMCCDACTELTKLKIAPRSLHKSHHANFYEKSVLKTIEHHYKLTVRLWLILSADHERKHNASRAELRIVSLVAPGRTISIMCQHQCICCITAQSHEEEQHGSCKGQALVPNQVVHSSGCW